MLLSWVYCSGSHQVPWVSFFSWELFLPKLHTTVLFTSFITKYCMLSPIIFTQLKLSSVLKWVHIVFTLSCSPLTTLWFKYTFREFLTLPSRLNASFSAAGKLDQILSTHTYGYLDDSEDSVDELILGGHTRHEPQVVGEEDVKLACCSLCWTLHPY